jgi:hypothetical protein
MNKTDNCGGMQTQKNPTCEIQVLERNTTNGFGQCYCIGVYENDDRYIVMKADAMSRDPRMQRYDWHKRDILPKCVVLHILFYIPYFQQYHIL